MPFLRRYGRRLFVDGLALSALFSAVALTSLWADPAIWLESYPPDVRTAVGDSLEKPALQQGLVALALFTVILGGLFVAVRRLDADLGGIKARTAGIHVFFLLWIVNAIDVLVVDWLFFMNLGQERVTFPGTEGLPGYDDYFFHFRVSFLTVTPWVGSILLATVSAACWWWFVIRRRSKLPS